MLNLVANGPSGYNLTNSLRFRSSASAYLNRTPTTNGDTQKWTLSQWTKRGTLGVNQVVETSRLDGSNFTRIEFLTGDTLQIWSVVSSSAVIQLVTTQVFRDPSAWYHIVVAVDTTQATAANRVKLYINGNQVTSFSTSTYPSQNASSGFWNQAQSHNIAAYAASTFYDGYLTDIYNIDGQALTPSSFGSTNSTTGVWQPAKYTGTYGTNGFYLNFSSIATTSGSNTGLGKDFSGNGNYWNTNNISVTSGTTYDAMTDVPTLTSTTTANYCVMNSAAPYGSYLTLSEANLKSTCNGAYWAASPATIGVSSGKWYWEVTVSNNANNTMIGIAKDTDLGSTTGQNVYPGISANSYGYIGSGSKYNNATGTAYGASYTTGDIIGVALDMDAGTLTFYKNNTSQGTAFSSLSGTYLPSLGVNTSATALAINFGQRPFTYTAPSGYLPLNTYNLPTSTIVQGNKYMDATLYTGNTPLSQTITNAASFKPDLVWLKSRSNAYDHYLWDSVRGGGIALFSDLTSAENNYGTSTQNFTSTGFSVGNNSGINNSGSTFVGWQWQAGQGSTSSNTSGSITSTVSVNASAGFSVVTYTSTTATSATIGHGLGVAPSMIIIKVRNGTSNNWAVYHKSLGNANWIFLNSSSASGTASGAWNTTDPTSSVFSVAVGGSTGNNWTNTAGYNYVAYCWAEIAGFSKFGSYAANGSTDGPFVYTGFQPKFLLLKGSTSSGGTGWYILDSTRNTYDVLGNYLSPNNTNAESSLAIVDFLSNGFKLRTTNSEFNASGQTWIYAAFASNPFKNSNAF